MNNAKKIYLDYSATTPCDPDVLNEMIPFFTEKFGNSGSRSHSFGWEAEEGLETAREQVAKSIGASKGEIIFTSGATESNNIAIKGGMRYLHKNKGKNHIITTVIEHKCVLSSCESLEEEGFRVTYLKVKQNGIVDLDELRNAITPETGMISIAWVHNEIGVIQPIKEIGEICKSHGIYFHTDAAQALGRVKIDVNENNIDMLSLSGHKIYGPKGIGALYMRRGVRVHRIISGGGQEKGIRSGTLPVPLCVGMGKAAEIAESMRESECKKMRELRTIMLDRLFTELKDITLNGDKDIRVPHNINISFSCVEGESLMMYLNGIAVSSGSACTSGSLEPSYVLTALGVDTDLVHTAIRIVFGRYTTKQDVEDATQRIIDSVNKLRHMSPLWDMKQAGIDLNSIQWTEH